jgi:hypothetical protein
MSFSVQGAEGHQNTERLQGLGKNKDEDNDHFENILNELLEAKLGKNSDAAVSKDSKEIDKLTERLSTAGISHSGTVSADPELYIKQLKKEGLENSVKNQKAPGFESYGLDILS